MDKPVNLNSENVYEITVKGDVDMSWLKDFAQVDVRTEIITGRGLQPTLFKVVADQAGLVGLVRRMHGLGIVLLSIRQVSTGSKDFN